MGVLGAAVASLLSLWGLNGLALLVMWRDLRLQPFSRAYFMNLLLLFGIALAASSLLQLSSSVPDILAIVVFLSVCLGSMVLLYRSGRLLDAADRDLLRATLARLPFRVPV
jgi:protein-S-isoprenylcysteine O-methyltransferase Ste14